MDNPGSMPADAAALVEAAVYAPPAFDPRRRWNGWAVTGICCVSFALFVVVQTAMFLLLVPLLRHPEILLHAGGPHAIRPLPNPQILAPLFTAPVLAATTIAGAAVLFFFTFALMNAAFRVTLRDLGIGMRAGLAQIVLGILAGFALLIASLIVQSVQTHFIGTHPQFTVEVMLTHRGARSFIFDLLSVSAIAPLAEEFFFRGVVFAAFVQRLPLIWAAVISGLIFGLAHFDPYNIAPLAVIGIGLGYLYHRMRSLWPNVIAHATVNSVSLVLVYLFPQLAK